MNKKPQNGFGLHIVIGIWVLFFIGFISSPKKPTQNIKELSSVIKIETLYVETLLPNKI